MQIIRIPAFFLFLAMIFFIVSCENNKAAEKNMQLLTMDCGYKYKHHIRNEGPKPQVGEVAYYYFILRADDSLMMNGRDAGMISKTQIPVPLSNPQAVASPTLEGLKLMSIGDSMTVIVPLDSIPQMPPGFEKFKNFYYDLVLIDIKSQEENLKIIEEESNRNKAKVEEISIFVKQVIDDYQAGKLDDKMTEKPSGLKYIIHEDGKGQIPEKGETVQVRYHSLLSDGKPYDSSFPNSHTYPIKVGAGSVTAAFDEALTCIRRGTKATFFVPSQLGYGEVGVPSFIAPNTDLVYYIELVK